MTTLVGTEGDERVGNDSYIGALATVVGECTLGGRGDYFAVRPHKEPVCGSNAPSERAIHFPAKFATLVNEPVRFDVQTQIAALMTQRMMSMASDVQRRAARGRSPGFTVRPFRVADGGLRYFATAEWKSGNEGASSSFFLGAWLSSTPVLRILAVEAMQNFESIRILNVADLGDSRTGMILSLEGEDGYEIALVEYRDGFDIAHMRVLQAIASGE